MDKGYQGAGKHLRVCIPTKKPPNRNLSSNERHCNDRILSDSVIAENNFGRIGFLWAIMSRKVQMGRTYIRHIVPVAYRSNKSTHDLASLSQARWFFLQYVQTANAKWYGQDEIQA